MTDRLDPVTLSVLSAALSAFQRANGLPVTGQLDSATAALLQKQGLLPLNQWSLQFTGCLAYHDYEGVALNDEEKPRLVADLGLHEVDEPGRAQQDEGLTLAVPGLPEGLQQRTPSPGRRRGGGHKRLYRLVDFKRRKLDMPATVERLAAKGTRLLITADGGGSNGARLRLWKTQLTQLATETGLEITVVDTPGHTGDSVCFHVTCAGERVVFTGDTLLGRGTTVVAWPDGFSASGILGLLNTVDEVRAAFNPNLELDGLIINHVRHTSGHRGYTEVFSEIYEDILLHPVIPVRSVISDARDAAMPVEFYERKYRTSSQAAEIFRDIAAKVWVSSDLSAQFH